MNQEELLKWLSIDAEPFRFEPTVRKELLELVEGKESAIEAMEHAALAYRLNQEPEDPVMVPPPKKKLLQEVKAFRSSAAALMKALNGSSRYVGARIVDRALLSERIDEKRFFSALYLIQHEAHWWLKHKRDGAMMRKRGKPKNDEVKTLNFGVARALDEAGFRITKGRDGLFASVLGKVREAVGEPMPVECFRELKVAADSVRRAKKSPLRAWIERGRKLRKEKT